LRINADIVTASPGHKDVDNNILIADFINADIVTASPGHKHVDNNILIVGFMPDSDACKYFSSQ
jgi:hypothetical protein